MATIKDLLDQIDCKDMKVQLMTRGHCDLAIRGRKDQYLEAKFKSDAENIYKEAIIIWVDKGQLNAALEAIKEK